MIFFFDESEWPLEKLRVIYGITIPAETKMVYDERRGKTRWISRTEMGVATPSGNFRESEWKEKVQEIIRGNGMDGLLEQIKEYCRGHCAWLKKEDEIEMHAMECMASRSYEHWDDFRRE